MLRIFAVVGIVAVLAMLALLMQDAWVKNKCLHPAKDFESDPKIVFRCQRTSWLAVLVDSVG